MPKITPTEDYYNDIEPFPCAWLQELINAGLIPTGYVDNRGIKQVDGHELGKYRRVNFFAGIGGWAYALELAGWPRGRKVWTGSCPCQSFSTAGKQRGTSDKKHVWPEFLRLIDECRPPTIFGEQVASKLGREWVTGVRTDLEALGYAVGIADLCAASVSAPFNGGRLFWVATSYGNKRLSTSKPDRRQLERYLPDEKGRKEKSDRSTNNSTDGVWGRGYSQGKDSIFRRTQSSIFPLAHGVSNRVGIQRGAGNAIVPQVAAVFIRSFLEAEGRLQDGKGNTVET